MVSRTIRKNKNKKIWISFFVRRIRGICPLVRFDLRVFRFRLRLETSTSSSFPELNILLSHYRLSLHYHNGRNNNSTTTCSSRSNHRATHPTTSSSSHRAVELPDAPDRGDDCCCFSRKNGPPGKALIAIFILVVAVQLPLFALSCLSVHYLREQTNAVNAKRGDQTIYAPFFYKVSASSDSTSRTDYAFFIPAGGEPLWRYCGSSGSGVPFRCPDDPSGGSSSSDRPGDCRKSSSDPDKTVELYWSSCDTSDFTKLFPDRRSRQLKESMRSFSNGLFAASVVGIVAPATTFLMMCFVACASNSCACLFGGDLRRLVRPILTVVCVPASLVGLICSAVAVAMVSQIWQDLKTIFAIPKKQDAPLPPNGIDNFESAAIGLLVCNCIAGLLCLVAGIMVCTEEPATATQHDQHDHDEGSEMHSLPPILEGQVQTSQPEPVNGVPFAHHIAAATSWPMGYTGNILSTNNNSNDTNEHDEQPHHENDNNGVHAVHSAAAFPSS